MVKPGDLKEGDYVGRLYERLNSQMEKIEYALKNAGQEHTVFSQMAGEIHSNVEFMNQVNQIQMQKSSQILFSLRQCLFVDDMERAGRERSMY